MSKSELILEQETKDLLVLKLKPHWPEAGYLLGGVLLGYVLFIFLSAFSMPLSAELTCRRLKAACQFEKLIYFQMPVRSQFPLKDIRQVHVEKIKGKGYHYEVWLDVRDQGLEIADFSDPESADALKTELETYLADANRQDFHYREDSSILTNIVTLAASAVSLFLLAVMLRLWTGRFYFDKIHQRLAIRSLFRYSNTDLERIERVYRRHFKSRSYFEAGSYALLLGKSGRGKITLSLDLSAANSREMMTVIQSFLALESKSQQEPEV